MQIVLLIGLLASILVIFLTIPAMLVLRYRGRRIPGWLIRLTATAFGLQAGLGGIVFIRQPICLGSLALLTVFNLWFLVGSGRRATGGLLLLIAGLAGALWWGFFLVQDLADPADLYEDLLWLWWAPSAALVVAGAILLRMGDHPVERRIFPQMPSLRRDPMALGNAITREMSIGPIPLPGLLADATALVTVIVAVALWGHLVPWPVTWLVAGVTYAAIGTELFYHLIPRGLRPAWEGFSMIGSLEMKRWQEVTRSPVPTNAAAMRAGLGRNPDRPEIRPMRAELHATMGELDAARQAAETMQVGSEAARSQQRFLIAWIDWLDGRDPDFDALAAEAEAVGAPDSQERAEARGQLAVARARAAAVRGEDWKAPLESYLAQSASAAPPALQEDLRRARFRVELPIGLIVSGAIVLLSNLVR